MSDPATDTPRPRLTLTDAYRDAQHVIDQLAARRDAEPWVTVEVTDAAKGEIRVETKVSAPLGCDMSELAAHALAVREIAEREHIANTARKGEAVAVREIERRDDVRL